MAHVINCFFLYINNLKKISCDSSNFGPIIKPIEIYEAFLSVSYLVLTIFLNTFETNLKHDRQIIFK